MRVLHHSEAVKLPASWSFCCLFLNEDGGGKFPGKLLISITWKRLIARRFYRVFRLPAFLKYGRFVVPSCSKHTELHNSGDRHSIRLLACRLYVQSQRVPVSSLLQFSTLTCINLPVVSLKMLVVDQDTWHGMLRRLVEIS
jgi:hypothetical protein